MKRFSLLLLILVVIFSACRKRPHPSWDVDLVAPLLYDSIFITDLINDTLYAIEPDYQLSFILEQELYNFNIDSLIQVPDTFVNFTLVNFFGDLTFDPGESIIDADSVFYVMDFENHEKLTYLEIESGELYIEVNNQTEADLVCEFSLNSVVKEGQDTLSFNEVFLSGEVFTKIIDFAGYSVDMNNFNGINDTANTINFDFAVFLHPDEETTTFIEGESIALEIYFDNIKINYARGYFGQNIFENQGIIEYDFLEDWQIDGFSAGDAEIKFNVTNYYGVSSSFKINSLTSTNTESQESVEMQGAALDSIFMMDQATEINPGTFNITPALQTFDLSASNMLDLVEILPDRFDYSFEIETNPEGDTTLKNNFFYQNTGVNLGLEAKLMQGIMIDDLLFSNTMAWAAKEMDLSMLDTLQNASATLKVDNLLPISLGLDLTLKQYEPFNETSFVQDFILESATVDSNGEVLSGTESSLVIFLSDELKTAIRDADSVTYTIRMNTAENKEVKLYDDQFILLQLIGDFGISIEF